MEQLIRATGFEPVKAGGMEAAIWIEMHEDPHEYGGLNGKLVSVGQARAALAEGTPQRPPQNLVAIPVLAAGTRSGQVTPGLSPVMAVAAYEVRTTGVSRRCS